MIIACPACGTKYVVPDDALGVDGRTVRCAKCKHSWFQDGPPLDLPVREEALEEAVEPVTPAREEERAPQPDPPPTEPSAPPPVSPPAPGPVSQEREQVTQAIGAEPTEIPVRRHRPAPQPAAAPVADAAPISIPDAALKPPPFYRASDQPPAGRAKSQSADGGQEDGDYASFDYQPPFRPRRNQLRLLTLAAGAFAVLALMAIAAIQFWGLPSWLPFSQPLFAGEEAGLAMSFPDDRQQTRTLPTGAEFLAVSGTITNTGRETRSVPPVLIVLRDGRNRVVYSQEIAPPRRDLAPGETAEVNEAIADVPQSAIAAEFGWAPR